jgi:hypothetical protein
MARHSCHGWLRFGHADTHCAVRSVAEPLAMVDVGPGDRLRDCRNHLPLAAGIKPRTLKGLWHDDTGSLHCSSTMASSEVIGKTNYKKIAKHNR